MKTAVCMQCGTGFTKARRVQPFCSLSCHFWSKVTVSGDACWVWQGTTNSDGYGIISDNYRTLLAHRVSFEIHTGGTAPVVRHTCDNPPCVNPGHLLGGSHIDNVADRVSRGRSRAAMNAPLGERNKWAKVDGPAVIRMRERVAAGEKIATMARDYGLTYGAVWRIVKRKCWKHL